MFGEKRKKINPWLIINGRKDTDVLDNDPLETSKRGVIVFSTPRRSDKRGLMPVLQL
jgi:hypothetical protein